MKKKLFISSVFVIFLLFIRQPLFAQENIRLFTPSNTSINNNDNNNYIVVLKSKPSTKILLSLTSQSPEVNIEYGMVNSPAVLVDIGSENNENTLDILNNNPNVATVIKNPPLIPLVIPNDPGVAATPMPDRPRIQWNLFNQKFAGEGTSAWDKTIGSQDAVVAVIDSTVDSSHPDLAGKFSSLVDCAGKPCQTVSALSVSDPNDVTLGHGTHVSGLVAASTNNAKGIAGSGYNTKIMMIKLIDNQGNMNISDFINAVYWASDHGAKVINMSIGILEANLDSSLKTLMQTAVNYAWEKGVVLVASAGNCGANTDQNTSCAIFDDNGNIIRYDTNPKVYPGALNHVLSVASLNIDNTLSVYSEHNDPSNPAIGNWVSVAAPGGDCSSEEDAYQCIASTWPGANYAYIAGTSMASPQVAGLAALVYALKPDATNSDVISIIENSADKNMIPGKTNFGAIDALAAVNLASLQVTVTPEQPTVTPTLPPANTPAPSPTVTPSNTPTVTLTPIPDQYTQQYNQWKEEFTGRIETKNTDFNHDGRVDIIDFEIWRRNNESN